MHKVAKEAYKNLGPTRAAQCLALMGSGATLTLTQLGKAIGADTMGLGNALLRLEKHDKIVRVPNWGPNGGFGWKLKVNPFVEMIKEARLLDADPVASAIEAMRELLARKKVANG
jgi:hypothetical protein